MRKRLDDRVDATNFIVRDMVKAIKDNDSDIGFEIDYNLGNFDAITPEKLNEMYDIVMESMGE